MGVSTSASIDGGMVYSAANCGLVSARSLQSGELIWERQLEGTVYASPVLTPTSVIATTRFRTSLRGDPLEGQSAAIDRTSGEVLWCRKHPAVNPGSPILIRGRYVCAYGAERLMALDEETGDLCWCVDTRALESVAESCLRVTIGSNLCGSDRVLVGTGADYVHAWDCETGEHLWSLRDPAPRAYPARGVACRDGVLYCTFGRRGEGNRLAAVQAESGEVLWDIGMPRGDTTVAPSIGGETLLQVLWIEWTSQQGWRGNSLVVPVDLRTRRAGHPLYVRGIIEEPISICEDGLYAHGRGYLYRLGSK